MGLKEGFEHWQCCLHWIRCGVRGFTLEKYHENVSLRYVENIF